MKSPFVRFAVLFLTFGLLAAACGGDDGLDAATQELVDAVEANMGTDNLPPGFEEDDVSCSAKAMVVGMGGASGALEKYGITPENAETAMEDWEPVAGDAQKVVDGLAGCVNLKEVFLAEFEGSGLPDEMFNCISDKVTEDLIKDVLLSQMGGDVDSEVMDAEMEATFDDCTPE